MESGACLPYNKLSHTAIFAASTLTGAFRNLIMRHVRPGLPALGLREANVLTVVEALAIANNCCETKSLHPLALYLEALPKFGWTGAHPWYDTGEVMDAVSA